MMENKSHTEHQIQYVTNFQDFVTASFRGKMNAICWKRKLAGDFSEIVRQFELNENVAELHPHELLQLKLSEQGKLAREILLKDMETLTALGTFPTLNLIKYYDRDDRYPFFPTDVYSFHVDSSPVPTDTFLCTYYGESSEILPNSQVEQKVLVPEIRDELKKIYHGSEEDFESFLSENFFDLHYLPKPEAQPIKLGLGHLYRLATEHPDSKALPCIHRAPMEKSGQKRLLLIC